MMPAVESRTAQATVVVNPLREEPFPIGTNQSMIQDTPAEPHKVL